MADKSKIKVEIEVEPQRLCDLLVGVFDLGACNYWVYKVDYEMPEDPDWSWCTPSEREDWEGSRKVYVAAMCGGHIDWVLLNDDENGPGETVRTGRKELIKGVKVMAEKYPHHFSNLVNDNDDAETSDVFAQCCVLGEIVYG